MNGAKGRNLRVIGIDPGTRVAGYGILDVQRGRIDAVACGCWDLGEKTPLIERLGQLSREFERVISHYRPTHICLEEAFVARNSRSAMLLGHARGVIMAKSFEAGLIYHGMAPKVAKMRVTGSGQASKESVAACVRALLKLEKMKAVPFDVTDALALAYALGSDLLPIVHQPLGHRSA